MKGNPWIGNQMTSLQVFRPLKKLLPADNQVMNKKKLVLTTFISIPFIILAANLVLWLMQIRLPGGAFPFPFQPKKAAVTLIAPLEFLFRYFDFNEKNSLKQWEEKLFQGRVKYWVDFEGPDGFVRSKSKSTASAIFYRIKFDVSEYPILTWKWRVGKFPEKKGIKDPKKLDDYAARVYVIFVSRFFTNFKCLEYVWDEKLPEGKIIESPYSSNIKQLVLKSGAGTGKEWVAEKRNIYDDYIKLFGEKPKMKVSAVALMTDAEGTESEAEGYFDDIQIGKNK